jgi:hypothetical protein
MLLSEGAPRGELVQQAALEELTRRRMAER